MEKNQLQQIEDFYKNQGYSGDKLRKILSKDQEWLKFLKEREKKLTKKISLTQLEKKKYVMSTDEDYKILGKIEQLEKLKLTKDEKFLVELIRTQLEHDWRKPLIRTVNKILRKHSKVPRG